MSKGVKKFNDMNLQMLKYGALTRNSASIKRLKVLFGDFKGGKKVKNGNSKKNPQKATKKYIGPKGGIYFIKNGKKKYIK
jgi:hypothetical protein